MADTVFFSWQADTPTKAGRNFIERALERALGQLNRHVEVDEPEREGLTLDRDTRGVAGQPPIVETIFRKIDATAVFVPDLTFVGYRLDGRPTPNPNVLIEYGWALKILGHGRIVPLMNTAYGEPTGDAMPFDMRHLRNPITYHLAEDAPEEQRKAVREELSKEIFEALKAVLDAEGYRDNEGGIEGALPFTPATPQGRPSRFRKAGAAVGIADRDFDGPVEIYLEDAPAAWLRLMPVDSPERSWSTPELRRAANEDGPVLTPLLAHSGFSQFRADDGMGTFTSGQEYPRTKSVTFAFETGEVWSIDAQLVSRIKRHSSDELRPGLPVVDLEREFEEALGNYTRFLERLSIPRPYRWIAGIEGIKTFGLFYPAPPGKVWMFNGPQGGSVADTVVEEGLLQPDQRARSAIRPFFAKLFSKCGRERPDYLDTST